MAAKKKEAEGTPSEKIHIKDEETRKRIHEHLTNENDVISYEDISNVKTSEIVETLK